MKTKKLLSVTIAGAIIASMGISVFGTQYNNNTSGGWSESKGYYVNTERGQEVFQNSLITRSGFPSATPDSHKGRRINVLVNSGGDAKSAAEGETVWYGKYHYTTARMELSNGTVKTSSGRVWDLNATKATSPYYLSKGFENTEARTYLGS